MTNYYAIPLMRSEGAGAGKLIVHTTFWDEYKYTGNFYYDLSKKMRWCAWPTGCLSNWQRMASR
ncbi:hypothetical protein ACFTAO_30140 [Paenibacillus rhizoplanae]